MKKRGSVIIALILCAALDAPCFAAEAADLSLWQDYGYEPKAQMWRTMVSLL